MKTRMRPQNHLRSSLIGQVKAHLMSVGNGFRRAAMIIASLDRQAADELLDRLPDGQAAAIRNEILTMPESDTDERQAVIRDFLHPADTPTAAELERNPTRSTAAERHPSGFAPGIR